MTPSVSGLLYCGLGLIKSTIETQMKHKTTISVTPGGDFYHPEHTSSLAVLWSTAQLGLFQLQELQHQSLIGADRGTNITLVCGFQDIYRKGLCLLSWSRMLYFYLIC